MFDFNAFRDHLTAACEHYERFAPTVCEWANDLFIRFNERPDDVRLSEIVQALRLKDAGGWMPANFAANLVYKLMHRLGQDTTGHAGY